MNSKRISTDAKMLIQRVPGVRAVAWQKVRGGNVLLVSATRDGARRSAELECVGPFVHDARAVAVLRKLIGEAAAAAYCKLGSVNYVAR